MKLIVKKLKHVLNIKVCKSG